MGKRKRTATTPRHNNPSTEPDPSSSTSPSGNMPFSSGTELASREKTSRLMDSNEPKQGPDNPSRLLNLHSSLAHQHCNLSRLSKRSRHHYSHHYSRRNIAGNHAGSSSSHAKNRHPLLDERRPFRFGSHQQAGLEFMHHGGGELPYEHGFQRPEREIHFELDTLKKDCGICRKPLNMAYVVGVLVCGHMYHTECLERRTSRERKSDPECPLCEVVSSPPSSPDENVLVFM